MADLKRNNLENRAFITRNWLPDGWVIEQNGLGQYLNVYSVDGNFREYHAANWSALIAWAEGHHAGTFAAERKHKGLAKC